MSSSIPKAVLYYSPSSIWSAVALLALQEKGYGEDEVDLKEVDISKGENFSPAFLRLNPKATVPTLVVPLEKTLGPDTESRYKAITDTKSVVEFLDKSRSAVSRTNTTSSAPAPALAPATIAFSAMSAKIIEGIHAEDGSPNTLLSLNARDHNSLKALAKHLVPFLTGRLQGLNGYITESESGTAHISEKTKTFWQEKKTATEALLAIMVRADKADAELDAAAKAAREEYFKNAKMCWGVTLKEHLVKLNGEIIGPYALGDQISIADLHIASWLSRIIMLSGGRITDDGDVAITKIEAHIEPEFHFTRDFAAPAGGARQDEGRPASQSKLAAFWDAMRERSSFQKVYANGLY
jgi:glutathione S-transferase